MWNPQCANGSVKIPLQKTTHIKHDPKTIIFFGVRVQKTPNTSLVTKRKNTKSKLIPPAKPPAIEWHQSQCRRPDGKKQGCSWVMDINLVDICRKPASGE